MAESVLPDGINEAHALDIAHTRTLFDAALELRSFHKAGKTKEAEAAAKRLIQIALSDDSEHVANLFREIMARNAADKPEWRK